MGQLSDTPGKPPCDDCGEIAGEEGNDWSRRRSCPRCGKKVCPFCFHHIHAIEIYKAKLVEQAEGGGK